MDVNLSESRASLSSQKLVPQLLHLPLAARHPVDPNLGEPACLNLISAVDDDGGHHWVGGRGLISEGQTYGVALSCFRWGFSA